MSIGYLVFAKRPKPNGGHGYEIVRMRDGTNMGVLSLGGAQNVLESMRKQPTGRLAECTACPGLVSCSKCNVMCFEPDPVEYVIGEIRGVEQ